MRNPIPLVTAALALTLSGCTVTKPASSSKPPPLQMAKQFKFKKTQAIELNYLLFLPKGYKAKSEKRWPLILFLHGAGERGTNVWKVATHGPPKNVTSNPDFPYRLEHGRLRNLASGTDASGKVRRHCADLWRWRTYHGPGGKRRKSEG